MARKKAASGSSSSPTNPKVQESKPKPPRWSEDKDVWVGFLNARMDDMEFERYDQWVVTNELYLQEQLEDLIATGAKLSVAYDYENEAWLASITGRLCLGLDGRCAASARGGSYNESISILLYKHYVMAEEDWGGYLAKSATFLKRG